MHACGEPQTLVEALVARAPDLRGVRVLTGWHGISPAPYAAREVADAFTPVTTIPGPATRPAIAEGRGEYLPLRFGELARAIRDRRVRVDVAFLQVSPPDAQGRCSLGVSVDCSPAMLDTARVRVAEVNAQMPVTRGDTLVPFDLFDATVEVDRPLLELPVPPMTAQFEAIGRAAAALVPDGATIQVGVGTMPNAVLAAFAGHKDLGVHSGLVSDGVMDLFRAGVITNTRKSVDPGRLVSCGVIGSRALFAAVDGLDALQMRPATYTHDGAVLAQQERFVAINSALQVDLQGNVNAEVVNGRRLSGPGGQPEFAAGAAAAPDGQSIFCLPATAKDDTISRIVAHLDDGAPVTTPAEHVTAVVTEYGAADLRGLARRARADAIAAIAHPNFRAALLQAATEY